MLAKLIAISASQATKLSQLGFSTSQMVAMIQIPQLKLIVKLSIVHPHKLGNLAIFGLSKRDAFRIAIQKT